MHYHLNNGPTSGTHLTIQSEFPCQEKLTNMDALLLLQPIWNKKSRQTYDLRKAVGKWALPIAIDLSKNNYPTSWTHLTIQSEFLYQEMLLLWTLFKFHVWLVSHRWNWNPNLGSHSGLGTLVNNHVNLVSNSMFDLSLTGQIGTPNAHFPNTSTSLSCRPK